MVGSRRNPARGKTGLPKIAAQRDFWEEERQAQRVERQAKRAVCHGALPATSRRSVASLRANSRGIAAPVRALATSPPVRKKRYVGMVGHRRNPTSGKTGLPKIAAQRDFWEEERQAQRAERQAKRAVCHGALPATSRRSVASLRANSRGIAAPVRALATSPPVRKKRYVGMVGHRRNP